MSVQQATAQPDSEPHSARHEERNESIQPWNGSYSCSSSAHGGDPVYLSAHSLLGLFMKEEEEIRLPVWRVIIVNKLSLVEQYLNQNTGCVLCWWLQAGSRRRHVETTCLLTQPSSHNLPYFPCLTHCCCSCQMEASMFILTSETK